MKVKKEVYYNVVGNGSEFCTVMRTQRADEPFRGIALSDSFHFRIFTVSFRFSSSSHS